MKIYNARQSKSPSIIFLFKKDFYLYLKKKISYIYFCVCVSNFRFWEILIALHVLRSHKSKNHIFGFWSVCTCIYVPAYVSVCVLECVSVISITQKQIIAEAPNMVFYICIIYRCYMNFFIEVQQTICVQRHTK